MFVSLGLGSVIATAFEAAPWLMAVGRHKTAIFIAVGALLALNYWLAIERPRRMNCAPGGVCHVDSTTMRVNRLMFWTSLAVYAGAVLFTVGALIWIRVQS